MCFSALQRAEIAEIEVVATGGFPHIRFSALQRAEIAEMRDGCDAGACCGGAVSVLFNEPKLLKWSAPQIGHTRSSCFSALQRAEIAEIPPTPPPRPRRQSVSVLFNEPKLLKSDLRHHAGARKRVSVLFNEPKLLKFCSITAVARMSRSFSALQRAEIAEIHRR